MTYQDHIQIGLDKLKAIADEEQRREAERKAEEERRQREYDELAMNQVRNVVPEELLQFVKVTSHPGVIPAFVLSIPECYAITFRLKSSRDTYSGFYVKGTPTSLYVADSLVIKYDMTNDPVEFADMYEAIGHAYNRQQLEDQLRAEFEQAQREEKDYPEPEAVFCQHGERPENCELCAPLRN